MPAAPTAPAATFCPDSSATTAPTTAWPIAFAAISDAVALLPSCGIMAAFTSCARYGAVNAADFSISVPLSDGLALSPIPVCDTENSALLPISLQPSVPVSSRFLSALSRRPQH
ncbi:hypothetical protein PCO85_11765 [Prodigiosinella aquatilis]|nr:hypothetical protein [Prodigiosinella sp. LS101]WJV51947.1 hypothetical protein PCO85_11765 [Prodigiosinella sp. LS101]WJV56303.1 hypothetical protein PCO84_11765 [Pectobacteriaceae bacterium C111]